MIKPVDQPAVWQYMKNRKQQKRQIARPPTQSFLEGCAATDPFMTHRTSQISEGFFNHLVIGSLATETCLLGHQELGARSDWAATALMKPDGKFCIWAKQVGGLSQTRLHELNRTR